jgi:hypothetical protein
MRGGYATFAGIVAGLIVGLLIGLAIAEPLQIDSSRWWALAGSALGAALAVSGAILAIHYEARQKERAERRRLADEIDGALKHVRDYERAAAGELPDEAQMRKAMKLVHGEYQHISNAMRSYKHTSAEIARAAKLLVPGHADQAHMLAGRNRHDSWDADANKHMRAVRRTLEKAKAELRA